MPVDYFITTTFYVVSTETKGDALTGNPSPVVSMVTQASQNQSLTHSFTHKVLCKVENA